MSIIRRLWLRLYFRLMPPHVLIEHRRHTLKRLSDSDHDPFDPRLPTFLRRQAD